MATKHPQHKNPENPETAKINVTALPQRRAADYLSTYSNYVEIGGSPWDFRLLFFEIVEDDTGKPIREKKARVVMSPQHAVAFTQILNLHVQKWLKEHAPDAVMKEKNSKSPRGNK